MKFNLIQDVNVIELVANELFSRSEFENVDCKIKKAEELGWRFNLSKRLWQKIVVTL